MTLDILACVKRVPATGGIITLTADGQEIDTRYAAFTVSPHEECAVEEAIRLVEANGGSTTVLTLGPPVAADQLRDALAMGAQRAILLQTDGQDWDPGETARAIVEAVGVQKTTGREFDLILIGNEAADTGDYQVGIRVAYALGRPVVTGIKGLELKGDRIIVRREAAGGWEIFEVQLPAVITVKEGINLPRYPTVPGRLKARTAPIETFALGEPRNALRKLQLTLPPSSGEKGEVLGNGPEAAPRLAAILAEIGVVAP
jgi:electron transfer flavoprotein beta subunit